MRPAAFVTWAPETNFPVSGSSWSLQPIKVLPVSDYFTPGVAIAAEDLNWILNGITASTTALLAQVGQQDGVNWTDAIDMNTATSCTQTLAAGVYSNNLSNNIVYDSYGGRWLQVVGQGGSPAANLMQSFDGRSWSAVGAALTDYFGSIVICNPNGDVCVVEGHSSKAAVLPAGSSTLTESASTWTSLGGGTFFQGLYVVWTTTATSHSADGVTFTAGPSTLADTSFGISAQSPTKLLLFQSIATGGGTSYYTSSDGITFTAVAAPWTSGPTSSQNGVMGASYDASAGLFVVLWSGGSTGPFVTWTSPTGTVGSWTASAGIPHVPTDRATPCFVCAGSEWVLAMKANNGASTAYRVLVSVDQGETWRFTRLPLMLDRKVSIYYSGSQFLLVDNFNSASPGAGNGRYFLSHSLGTPAALVY